MFIKQLLLERYFDATLSAAIIRAISSVSWHFMLNKYPFSNIQPQGEAFNNPIHQIQKPLSRRVLKGWSMTLIHQRTFDGTTNSYWLELLSRLQHFHYRSLEKWHHCLLHHQIWYKVLQLSFPMAREEPIVDWWVIHGFIILHVVVT